MKNKLVYYTEKSLVRSNVLYYNRSICFAYYVSDTPNIEFWKRYIQQKVKNDFDTNFHKLVCYYQDEDGTIKRVVECDKNEK